MAQALPSPEKSAWSVQSGIQNQILVCKVKETDIQNYINKTEKGVGGIIQHTNQ